MLGKAFRLAVSHGPAFLCRRLLFSLQGKRAKSFNLIRRHIRGDGIEVGGPSELFEANQALPVYPLVDSLENHDFSARSDTFAFDGRQGRAVRTPSLALDRPTESCDFVLSCHMLEHVANPLKALAEWRRVLKPDGALLLVLPDSARTFDNRRPVTTLEHLRSDLANDVGEEDLTHIREAIDLMDCEHWSFPKHWSTWTEVYAQNAMLRHVHHHVFDERLAADMVKESGFDVLESERIFSFNIVVLARKSVIELVDDYQA